MKPQLTQKTLPEGLVDQLLFPHGQGFTSRPKALLVFSDEFSAFALDDEVLLMSGVLSLEIFTTLGTVKTDAILLSDGVKVLEKLHLGWGDHPAIETSYRPPSR